MADTTYVDGVVINAPWMQDANAAVYRANSGIPASGAFRKQVDRNNDCVSVKDYGAVGDGVTNDYVAVQSAINGGHRAVFFPNGTYNLAGNTLSVTQAIQLVGESRRGVILTRTGAGPIITMAYLSSTCYMENLYFTGTGNTGVTMAATAGAFQGYLIEFHIRHCDFAYELAFGINADLIFAKIESCTFGVNGTVGGMPAAGASTMVGIKSVFYPATANYTNLNTVIDCRFACGNAALTTPAVQITSGDVWKFTNCDFEACGSLFVLTDVGKVEFDHCWFERNVSTTSLSQITGSGATTTEFRYCNFIANTVGAGFGCISYATTVPTTLKIHDCLFAKNAGYYCIYDNPTTSRTLPGNGCVHWWDNQVTGDTVSDKCTTTTEFRGGRTSPRAVITFDSTGATGTILSTSDAGASIAKNGGVAGDSTVTISHPAGTSVNTIGVSGIGRTANANRSIPLTTTTIRVQQYTDASVPADGIFTLTVYGY